MTFLKNDVLWRMIIGFFLTILVGIGGWGLLEVTAMPKVYITKTAANIQKAELSKQICDLKDDINREINEMENRLHNRITAKDKRDAANQTKIENKLEKINELILKHMSNDK